MQLSTNNDQKKKKNTKLYCIFWAFASNNAKQKEKRVSLLHIQLPKSSILVKLKICYLQSSYGNCVNLHWYYSLCIYIFIYFSLRISRSKEECGYWLLYAKKLKKKSRKIDILM